MLQIIALLLEYFRSKLDNHLAGVGPGEEPRHGVGDVLEPLHYSLLRLDLALPDPLRHLQDALHPPVIPPEGYNSTCYLFSYNKASRNVYV